ncbi:MAG: anhydro-N-acetylmuramic acid kinase [Terriglobales bacterium]
MKARRAFPPADPAPARLAAGVMTGTSCDAVDVALVSLTGPAHQRRVELASFASFPFAAAGRRRLLAACDAPAISVAELARLNVWLAETIAAAVGAACRQAKISRARLALIASHGQTIYHQGRAARFLGRPIRCTWQLGEPAVIAARCGVPVIANFRAADMALGGQGAPLVPYLDWLLLRHRRQPRAVLNIGGIANLTLLPPAAGPSRVQAFDTGPGNMVMDAIAAEFSQGRERMDRGGRRAARGRVILPLLRRLLADPYYRQPPPKSCGREQYGHAFVTRMMAAAPGATGDDLMATAASLTAQTIALGLGRRTRWEVIASGGGVRNPALMRMLAAAAPHCRFTTSEQFGIPPQAKEAMAFAVLGDRTLGGLPANLPTATGAAAPAILGQIAWPPPG